MSQKISPPGMDVIYLAVLCFLLTVSTAGARANEESGNRVIASVDGEPIYLSEVDEMVSEEISSAREYIYETRVSAIDSIIRKKVIEQAAGKAGLSTDEYWKMLNNVDIPAPSRERVTEYMDSDFYEDFSELPLEVQQVLNHALFVLTEYELSRLDRESAIEKRIDAMLVEARVAIRLQPLSAWGERVDVPTGSTLYLGNNNAPIDMVVFYAFDCPMCATYHDTLLSIVDEYNPWIKLSIKHFPLDEEGPAMIAAKGVVCGNHWGQSWPMFNGLQSTYEEGIAAVMEIARLNGISDKEMRQCLGNHKTIEQVYNDIELGEELGVNGTPQTYINGIALSGKRSAWEIRGIIEGILEQERNTVASF
jgi:protein-disulfide isomerase